MSELFDATDTADMLTIALPGVVSWSRPRRLGGQIRYPPSYARSRDVWAAVVAHAVVTRGWRLPPPVRARYSVRVAVYGGGRRDLDRVCTAVLDALQGGGALRDDCLVDALAADRIRLRPGEQPLTVVQVASVVTSTGAPGARPGARPPGHAPRR